MCCTPYVATIVAGVLCLFQSFTSLFWNVPLIIGLSVNKTEILSVTPIDVSELENPFVTYGVALLISIVNFQLLIFSCLLFKANINLRTDWMSSWLILMLVKSLLNVILGIYFIYEYGNDPLKRIAYFRLGVLLSGIFFFWPTVNIGLLIMVFKRYSDISNSRRVAARESLEPLHDDSQPPPYTPGPYITRQQSRTIDPAPITGWSHQTLLNFDSEEGLLNS
ncbi:uncharacterized protein TNCT_655751 [Trichonephila clavata]|uniref:Uncharacterized protein n=1 Tax=Trichonephila clavata TaxID=2740835 RepID=A0A8X6F6M6_TRICU|nr:uncharacterized protein TNCT_655751 [Trichonephila clavata]